MSMTSPISRFSLRTSNCRGYQSPLLLAAAFFLDLHAPTGRSWRDHLRAIPEEDVWVEPRSEHGLSEKVESLVLQFGCGISFLCRSQVPGRIGVGN